MSDPNTQAAADRGDLDEAEAAFFEAWPYLHRVSSLLSAANMIVRRRPLAEGARRRIAS